MITVTKKYGYTSKGINKAIKSALENGVSTVKLHPVDYNLDEPVDIYLPGSFACLRLIGEGTWQNWKGGTRIIMNYNEGYAIGVQLGKGVEIDGISIKGRFNPDTNDFYRRKLEDFTDQNIKEDRHNPYAGISIDPKNTGGSGGSTATTIKNCRIFNTCVGVASSPNGHTQNAELTDIHKVQFGFNRVAVSGSHDQERNCVIRHSQAWENVHTFFSSHEYGMGIAGNWTHDNISIAGKVNTYIDWRGRGRYGLTLRNINSENLGRLGTIDGQAGIYDSEFGFAHPSNAYDSWQVEAQCGANFHNTKFRYYGEKIPVNIKGNAEYDDLCQFEVPPNFGIAPYYSGIAWKPSIVGCMVNDSMWVQADPVTEKLGQQNLTKGKCAVNGAKKGEQILWENPAPPYGWLNAGFCVEDGIIDYCPVEGNYEILTIKNKV